MNDVYVLNIEELDVSDITYSVLHLVNNEGNSFYVYSLCTYDDIFQEDVVNCYALPMATSSFDNVGGGTTNVIVLAGAYIEKMSNVE